MDQKLNCNSVAVRRSPSPSNKNEVPQEAAVRMQPWPLHHFCKVLKKFEKNQLQDEGGAIRCNIDINQIYIRRLHDVDTKGKGNLELKVITYQEWVENLLHMNENLLTCMVELETEICKRMALTENQCEFAERQAEVLKIVNEEHSPLAQELGKARHDIQRLLSLLRSGYYFNQWNLDEFKFETINPNEIFNRDEFKNIERPGGGCQVHTEKTKPNESN